MEEQAKNPHQWPSSASDLLTRRRAFGEKLRAAREAKGLSAQALSQLTRINQHYIEALEEGALELAREVVHVRRRRIVDDLGQDRNVALVVLATHALPRGRDW